MPPVSAHTRVRKCSPIKGSILGSIVPGPPENIFFGLSAGHIRVRCSCYRADVTLPFGWVAPRMYMQCRIYMGPTHVHLYSSTSPLSGDLTKMHAKK